MKGQKLDSSGRFSVDRRMTPEAMNNERREYAVRKRDIQPLRCFVSWAVCKGVFRDVKQAHKRRAIVYEYERLERLKKNKNCRVCRCLVGF